MMRVGHGFDVHRFSDDADRPLVLGGVVFAGERAVGAVFEARGENGRKFEIFCAVGQREDVVLEVVW